jgi:hypothetical protein
MKKNIDLYFVLTIAGIISLGFIYIFLWAKTTTTKTERDGLDFMGLYSAATISKVDGFAWIYDPEKQIDVQSRTVGFQFPVEQTSYFTHPPFIILLVNLIADDNYINSAMRWWVILLLVNGLTTYILIKSLDGTTFSRQEIWTLAAGTFLFWPTYEGFMNGQDSHFILLAASTWMLYLSKNELKAGLGLGLSVIRPQLAIALSLPFIFKKQKIFLGFAISAAVLALISFAMIGYSGTLRYIDIVRVVSDDLWRLPHTKDMPTITGLIRRLFVPVDRQVFDLTIWSSYLIGLALIVLWWKRVKKADEHQIGILVLIAIIIVPYAHYHELSLLLVPLLILIRSLADKRILPNRILAILPLAVSFVLMAGFIGMGIQKYLTVYIVMFMMGYYLQSINRSGH